MYKTQRSEVLDKLNKQIAQTGDGDGGDDEFLHSFFSSIPYLFVPGAGTVFQVITENSGKIGAVFGSKGGPLGTIIGATIGTISGGALGMKLAY